MGNLIEFIYILFVFSRIKVLIQGLTFGFEIFQNSNQK